MADELQALVGMQAGPAAEPEIHVIPEKFYGTALKARLPEAGAKPEAAMGPPKKKTGLLIGGLVFVVILGAGGAFVYFNQELLFPKPAPQVTVVEKPPAPPPQPPTSPVSVVATSTNPQSVSVSWVDMAANESGFRLERAEDTGTFQGITNLPPNSTSFLDVTVRSGKTYRYRLIASNQDGDSAPSSEAAATVPEPPPPPPEAPKLPPAGLDTDSDGLTDLEEDLFKADPRNPDVDGDGFLDGNEVFHLYNPNGRAPARLIDAKLVNVVNGPIGWSMQIPAVWSITVTGDGSQAVIQSGHGESFKISVEDNPQTQPVLEWYLAKNPEIKATQALQYRSKQGYEGIIGADLLTTYIPWGSRIFVFSYVLADQPFINFRTSYSMMLNSLQLKGLPEISAATAAAEAPLPFEPAATTTGVITQPLPVEIFPTPAEPTSTTPAEASSEPGTSPTT